jgi:hypothetical protein
MLGDDISTPHYKRGGVEEDKGRKDGREGEKTGQGSKKGPPNVEDGHGPCEKFLLHAFVQTERLQKNRGWLLWLLMIHPTHTPNDASQPHHYFPSFCGGIFCSLASPPHQPLHIAPPSFFE